MLMPCQDSEWEELIRTGQMTPFGTTVPPKEERKPRRLMLNESSDFDKYLADQAQMAASRKRTPKKEKVKPAVQTDPTKVQDANKNVTIANADKRLKKRMRKLQKKAFHNQFRTGIPRKKKNSIPEQYSQGDDSEGSIYAPDIQESLDEDDEEWAHDSPVSDYELKPLTRKPTAKRPRHPAVDPEFLPSSDEEELSNLGKRRKWKDDGNFKLYKYRIR